MSLTRVARATLLALITLSAACGDSTGPGDTNMEGSLRFSYAGAVSGTFAAEGALDTSPTGGLPTSAAAAAIEQEGMLAVMGVRPVAGNRVDMFVLSLGEKQGTGTVSINMLSCQDPMSGRCPSGIFMLGFDPEGTMGMPGPALPDTPMFVLTAGSITVTSRSATRIRGTFSGVAMSLDTASPAVVMISGGTFDVPVVRE